MIVLLIFATEPGAAPQNVTAQSLTLGTIELSWSPPPVDKHYGILTGYFITYQISGSSRDPVSENVDDLDLTIEGLQSNTTYRVTIAAVNGAGTSMLSAVVEIITIPDRE